MTSFLDSPLTTLAFCWRLERRDGVALGFTSHDRDLFLDGLLYRAAPGIAPSAVTLADGFDAGSMDVAGALSADGISEADLESGRWDGAGVILFAVDWETPGETLVLARGELGAAERKGDAFSAELRGAVAVLERTVVEETSPECRAALGDRRCRVDLAGRRVLARVSGIDGAALEMDRAEPVAGAYGYGMLRWIDGANAGLSGAVLSSAGHAIVLRDLPALPVAIGDRAELIEGCDRSLAMCRGRFGNAVNFRGEPHLPGNDLLTRYPGA